MFDYLKKVPKIVWLVLAAIVIWLFVNFAVLAGPPGEPPPGCGPYAEINRDLVETYGEQPVGIGRLRTPVPVELWRGERTWTVLVRLRDDIACIIAFGDIGYPVEMRPGV